MKRFLWVILSIIILSISGISPQVPVTGGSNSGQINSISLCSNSISSSLGAQPSPFSAKTITGLEVEDHFSFSVIEQPLNNAGFVSEQENTVTRFRTADKYGSTGFLAHNYLAGAEFFSLKVGDRIDLLLEGGEKESFWVFSIRKFQALAPCSAYSDFVDLDTGHKLSAAELFMNFYGQDDLVVLQTCIEKDGVQSWGRLFILAYPVSAQFFKPWPTGVDAYLEG